MILEIMHTVIAIGAIIELVDKAPRIPGMIKSIAKRASARFKNNKHLGPNQNPNKINFTGMFIGNALNNVMSGILLGLLPFGIYISGVYSAVDPSKGLASAALFIAALFVVVFDITN